MELVSHVAQLPWWSDASVQTFRNDNDTDSIETGVCVVHSEHGVGWVVARTPSSVSTLACNLHPTDVSSVPTDHSSVWVLFANRVLREQTTVSAIQALALSTLTHWFIRIPLDQLRPCRGHSRTDQDVHRPLETETEWEGVGIGPFPFPWEWHTVPMGMSGDPVHDIESFWAPESLLWWSPSQTRSPVLRMLRCGWLPIPCASTSREFNCPHALWIPLRPMHSEPTDTEAWKMLLQPTRFIEMNRREQHTHTALASSPAPRVPLQHALSWTLVPGRKWGTNQSRPAHAGWVPVPKTIDAWTWTPHRHVWCVPSTRVQLEWFHRGHSLEAQVLCAIFSSSYPPPSLTPHASNAGLITNELCLNVWIVPDTWTLDTWIDRYPAIASRFQLLTFSSKDKQLVWHGAGTGSRHHTRRLQRPDVVRSVVWDSIRASNDANSRGVWWIMHRSAMEKCLEWRPLSMATTRSEWTVVVEPETHWPASDPLFRAARDPAIVSNVRWWSVGRGQERAYVYRAWWLSVFPTERAPPMYDASTGKPTAVGRWLEATFSHLHPLPTPRYNEIRVSSGPLASSQTDATSSSTNATPAMLDARMQWTHGIGSTLRPILAALTQPGGGRACGPHVPDVHSLEAASLRFSMLNTLVGFLNGRSLTATRYQWTCSGQPYALGRADERCAICMTLRLDGKPFESIEDSMSMSASSVTSALDGNISEQAVQLPCRHCFCYDCIEQWVDRTSKCPLCRDSITRTTLDECRRVPPRFRPPGASENATGLPEPRTLWWFHGIGAHSSLTNTHIAAPIPDWMLAEARREMEPLPKDVVELPNPRTDQVTGTADWFWQRHARALWNDVETRLVSSGTDIGMGTGTGTDGPETIGVVLVPQQALSALLADAPTRSRLDVQCVRIRSTHPRAATVAATDGDPMQTDDEPCADDRTNAGSQTVKARVWILVFPDALRPPSIDWSVLPECVWTHARATWVVGCSLHPSFSKAWAQEWTLRRYAAAAAVAATAAAVSDSVSIPAPIEWRWIQPDAARIDGLSPMRGRWTWSNWSDECIALAKHISGPNEEAWQSILSECRLSWQEVIQPLTDPAPSLSVEQEREASYARGSRKEPTTMRNEAAPSWISDAAKKVLAQLWGAPQLGKKQRGLDRSVASSVG